MDQDPLYSHNLLLATDSYKVRVEDSRRGVETLRVRELDRLAVCYKSLQVIHVRDHTLYLYLYSQQLCIHYPTLDMAFRKLLNVLGL